MSSNTKLKRIPKRIIICCDGTWQSAVDGKKNQPSNVTRLARSLSRDDLRNPDEPWQQIVWYDSGVGTTSSWLGKKTEGAIGAGLEGNIIEAYNFVVLNYNEGDKICCFGFSRGAFTARSIAGLISDIGVCSPDQMQNFPEIWDLYKKPRPIDQRFRGSDEWFEWREGKLASKQPKDATKETYVWEKPPHNAREETEDATPDGRMHEDEYWGGSPESRTIEVVGVWDTVGALGMPEVNGYKPQWWGGGEDRHSYHNVNMLNRNTKHAFHALALDEHRNAFSPTLWYLPPFPRGVDEELRKNKDRVLTEQAVNTQRKIVSESSKEWNLTRFDFNKSDKESDKLRDKYYAEKRKLMDMQEYFESPEKPDLVQTWFPGYHINVGGGNSETLLNMGDLEEMSSITYAWMLDRIRDYLLIDPVAANADQKHMENMILSVKHLYEAEEKRKTDLAESIKKETFGGTLWRKTKDTGSTIGSAVGTAATSAYNMSLAPTEPVIRNYERDWGTAEASDSYTWEYWMNHSVDRMPGLYSLDKNAIGSKRSVSATDRSKGGAGVNEGPPKVMESVHPVVAYRMWASEQANPNEQKKWYKPIRKEREDFHRSAGKMGGWEYVLRMNLDRTTHDVTLPEFEISTDSDSFERKLLLKSGETAQKWVKTNLDQPNAQ